MIFDSNIALMITDILYQLSVTELILCITFLLSLLIQLYIYLVIYSRVLLQRKKKHTENGTFFPVSVIIAAKNESYNLPENLPLILDQEYPEFQVVVVDDCSEDDTWDVLEALKRKYNNLYTTRIHFNPIFKHGKKMALSLGIKAAKNNILVFTDADCKPASKLWLKKLVSAYNNETGIVLGYSPILKVKGFLNRMIRYDNIFTALQYLGSALSNRTYMGVGRNLSYKKSLFLDNKGFAPHVQLMSGDDDLFINKVSGLTKSEVVTDPDAHVFTPGKKTWKDWVIQKRRHLTTGRYYKFSDKWRLGLEITSRFFFYATFIALLFYIEPVWLVLAFFGLRFIVQGIVINLTASTLKQSHFIFSFWFLDIMLPLIYSWMFLKNIRNPKGIKWK